MRRQTVTMLGIYDRNSKVGFHVQVRNHSSAVLLSEIRRFMLLGTRILSDGMDSYERLPESGYSHGVVIHKREFVQSEDRSVHTQNIEVRNRWLKAAVKSYKKNRPLQLYCVEYEYRYVYFSSVTCNLQTHVGHPSRQWRRQLWAKGLKPPSQIWLEPPPFRRVTATT